MIAKLAVSGQLRVGKNYIAERCEYPIIGFADPIYKIVEYFTGTSDKNVPGIREMMQKIGQWGWGKLDAEYPFSVERGLFVRAVREVHTVYKARRVLNNCSCACEPPHPFGNEFKDVDWYGYGAGQQDFWVQIMLNRSRTMERVAVVNTRFQHELQPLAASGFQHFHVMCSEETRRRRMGNEAFNAKTLNDTSEQFALWCNTNLPDWQIIWNDDAPQPSGKQYTTVDQFVKLATGRRVSENT